MSRGDELPNPGGLSGVWPPPPTKDVPVGAMFPFRTEFRTLQGSVPDFRVGTLSFSEHGLQIQGKAVLPNEIQIPILIASLPLQIGWLVAYLILEYAVRRDRSIQVPLSQISRIVLNARKRRACVIYSVPNSKGTLKRYSLTTRMASGTYEHFTAVAQKFLPGVVAEGKLKPSSAPIIWVIVVGGIVYFMFMVFALMRSGF